MRELERAKRIFEAIDRVASPFKKQTEHQPPKRTESEMIAAVIDRIPIEGEGDAPVYPTQDESEAREEEYRKLVRRLRRQIKRAGITSDELIRTHSGPVNTILLFKSAERYRRRESSILEERLARIGFRQVQNGLWLLPPATTPSSLSTQDDLKLWVHQNLTKPLGREMQFVLPFVALVDLKRVVAEKRGIRKVPLGRTIFNVLELEEAVAPTHVYEHLKRKGMGIEKIISSGDLLFLTSSFCDESTLAALDESFHIAIQRLQRTAGPGGVSLEALANLDPAVLSEVLKELVPHPKDTAQRTIVEAQFWMRFLSGTEA